MNDYTFQLPGRTPFVVPGWANLPVEIAAACAGVKPAIHAWLEESEEGALRDLCSAFRFHHVVFRRSKGESPPRIEAILGPDKDAVEHAAYYWYHPSINPGRYLGYPDCCVAFFRDWSAWARRRVGMPDFVDILPYVYKNTRRPHRLSFLLNNAFYCYSRHWVDADSERRRRLDDKNPGLDLGVMNILTFHPCSYRCPKAKLTAEKTWKAMQSLAPHLAASVKVCLSRPILFWDWYRYAVLKGTCAAPGVCSYSSINPPFSLLEADALSLLQAGDKIVIASDGKAAVFKGRKKIGVFEDDPPLLLDFR